ncbi:MAG: ABC transporter substrate-binding protein [Candidatus Omnitrophica bacterium]|nr:ABC transporter substrate-binding protein [Candidatus Omnitrophota bacterium]
MLKVKKNIILLGITLIFFFISAYIIIGYLKKEDISLEKVTIACYRGEPAALIYLAKQEGLFRKNGIELTIKDCQAGKLAVDALVAAETDLAIASESTLVANSFQHRNLKVLTVVSEGKARKVVARKDQGVKNPSDLAGKRIALVEKSADEYYLGHFLSLYNLEFSEVKTVYLKPSQIVAELIAGTVDAGIIRDLSVCQKKKKIVENGVIWNLQTYNPFYFLLITKTKWVNDHPQCASSFMKALLQAENIITRDKNVLYSFFKNEFNYQDDCLRESLARNSYYIYLPQALLFECESQAFWRIKNKLTKEKRIPNYLNFIYPYALEVADSQRVDLIR